MHIKHLSNSEYKHLSNSEYKHLKNNAYKTTSQQGIWNIATVRIKQISIHTSMAKQFYYNLQHLSNSAYKTNYHQCIDDKTIL